MSDDIKSGPFSFLVEMAGHDEKSFYELVERAVLECDIEEFISYFDLITDPKVKARVLEALYTLGQLDKLDLETIKAVTVH